MAGVGHLGFLSVEYLPQRFRTARHQHQFVLNSVLGGLSRRIWIWWVLVVYTVAL